MKHRIMWAILILLLAACGASQPTLTPSPLADTPTASLVPTRTVTPTETPWSASEDFVNFNLITVLATGDAKYARFTPDGNIAVVWRDTRIEILNRENFDVLQTYMPEFEFDENYTNFAMQKITFDSFGNLLVWHYLGKYYEYWGAFDLYTHNVLDQITSPFCITVTQSNMIFVCQDYGIYLWKDGSNEPVIYQGGHTDGVWDVKVNLDETLFLSQGGYYDQDNPHILWDIETGEKLDFPAGRYSVFHPVKNQIATFRSIYLREFTMWDVDQQKSLYERNDIQGGEIRFTSDGERFVIISRFEPYPPELYFYDTATGDLIYILEYGESYILEADFSLNGEELLISRHDGTVELWQMQFSPIP